MYTLKLDWSEERIEAVRFALETFVVMYTTERASDRLANIRAAIADIDLYRDTTEEVKASLTTDTSGYCTGCGEYITFIDGTQMWLSFEGARRNADGYFCRAEDSRQHIKG